MRRIYQSAESAVVWLGKMRGKGALGIDLLLRLNRLEVEAMRDIEALPHDPEKWTEHGLPQPEDASWGVLNLILSSPWFTRKWIIQEMAVSKSVTVLIGAHEIDWDDLWKAMSRTVGSGLAGVFKDLSSNCIHLGFLRVTYHLGVDMPLLYLLVSFRHHQASDPRDHIYALMTFLGGARGDDPSGLPLQFDYHRSFAELSILITRMLTAESKRLDCLTYIANWPETTEDASSEYLPSWVPDWSKYYKSPASLKGSYGEFEGLTGGFFAATKDSSYAPRFPERPGSLTVQSMLVDTIVCIGEKLAYGSPYLLWRLLDWKAMADQHLQTRAGLPQYRTRASVREFHTAFCSTILGGSGINGSEIFTSDVDHVIEYLDFLETWRASGLPEDSHVKGLQNRPEVYKANDIVRNACKGRRLIVTATGRIGLVPETGRIADVICLMMGSNVQFTVRTVDEGIWQVVGHSYVYGIMAGEAFVEENCDNMQLV